MKKMINYYRHSKEELNKVLFPTWAGDDSGVGSVRNAAISVIVVVSVVTLFLALVDSILAFIVSAVV
ncbi:preprotein translocase subunit SecE [Helicobacter monodelphidis]|uniref:preprotein translocase subunit SecE n=1 Tax=Helicobacter sp. 15-1451 TaxID=2004995 RepID=UPI000DCB348C|nr:preprotein translocase subunit SecE [Helicobacter sp. 15-1451]RAX57775.1 preprotein translocase subunit SecE [Helicobacter sp. 15-1451]